MARTGWREGSEGLFRREDESEGQREIGRRSQQWETRSSPWMRHKICTASCCSCSSQESLVLYSGPTVYLTYLVIHFEELFGNKSFPFLLIPKHSRVSWKMGIVGRSAELFVTHSCKVLPNFIITLKDKWLQEKMQNFWLLTMASIVLS